MKRNRHLVLMGVLNVTPDSFSDGGCYVETDRAVRHAIEMLDAGAGIIDIGGESTRPGADFISPEEETARVVPVIAELKRQRPECVISIDTRKVEVAAAAVEAGAQIVNDISGLQCAPEIAELAAEKQVSLVLMHMRGDPETMQSEANLVYDDVVSEVSNFLSAAAAKAQAAGVPPEKIIIDPGIGFAKTVEQNFALLGAMEQFKGLGYRVLVGPSRKSFIGKTLGIEDPAQRVWGTGGAVAFLALAKCDIIRVHDVREMNEMLTIFERCMDYYTQNKRGGEK